MKRNSTLIVALIAMGSTGTSFAQENAITATVTNVYLTSPQSGNQSGGNNEGIRVYNKTNYTIIDKEGFYLYKRTKLAHIIKGPGTYITEYSFSISESGAIMVLTIDNLKRAFPAYTEFHYLLDSIFNDDKELMAYDPYLKMYKVKYLFNKSSKS